ncbi:MAG: tetratricopeptide repeat protein [Nitrospirae bacterium]|nr:MAG: tetratricopeptide repeat protein [Nitrospirota bacterium]
MGEHGQIRAIRQVWFHRSRLRILLISLGVAGAVSAGTGAALWWVSAPGSSAEDRNAKHGLMSLSSPVIRDPASVASELSSLPRSVLQNERSAGKRVNTAMSSLRLGLPVPASTPALIRVEESEDVNSSSPHFAGKRVLFQRSSSLPGRIARTARRQTKRGYEKKSRTHTAARTRTISKKALQSDKKQAPLQAMRPVASSSSSIDDHASPSSSNLPKTGHQNGTERSTVGSKKSLVSATDQRLNLARRFIRKGQFARALTILNAIGDSSPSSWALQFWKGTALLGLGRLDEADAAFARALAIDDGIPSLWVQRAVVSQQSGNHARALDYLRQAELLAPDLPEVLLNLGYSLEAEGFMALARRYYRRFLLVTQGRARYRRVYETIEARLADWSRPSR